VTLLLWTVGGAGFLSLVGALFGAVAGLLARANGSAPGGIIGSRVLRAVERVLDTELTPPQAGALVGACDGASFLGAVGCFLGLAVGHAGWFSTETLLVICLGTMILAAAAAHFGLLAYGFLRAGLRAVGVSCAGAVAGVFIGAWLLGALGIFIGGEVGALGGLLIAILSGRRAKPPAANKRLAKDTWDQFRFKEQEP